MKIVHKNNLYNVLDIYIEDYPRFLNNGKQYEADVYVAVRTDIGTFEVNGKSKAYNIIINSRVISKDYLDIICIYSGKKKVIYETELEKSFFKPLISK